MSKQLFKIPIPSDILFSFLNELCITSDKYYIISNEIYKKGIFNNSIQEFIEKCTPYYHVSKKKYLERKMTYNNFTTILRQICNYTKTIFTTHFKYDKSKYNIVYHIFLPVL